VSPLWPSEQRIAVSQGGLADLPEIRRGARVTAIVSSHHARYALLPWSANLASENEWQAYARHRLSEVFGPQAEAWNIRVSPSPRGAARLACGIERPLLDGLHRKVAESGARLVSVRPGLMDAFNAQRRQFRRASGWLVAAEEGRIAVALIVQGLWQLVRVRNVGPAWREELPSLLRREEQLAKREAAVERVVLA
jgi:hypothetical protein